MKSLIVRSIAGLVFAFIVIGSIIFKEGFLLPILLTVIGIGGLWEFYNIAVKAQLRPNKIVGFVAFLIIATLLLASRFANNIKGNDIVEILFITVCLFPFLTFILELYRNSTTPLSNIATTILGPLYIGVPLLLFYAIRALNFKESIDANNILVSYFFILWASDSGAYAFGSLFGKHKLFKRISPNKSWEGFIGGGIVAVAVAIGCSYLKENNLGLIHWIIIALIIVITGTLGDLAESMLKRSVNIKDSGNIIPGHGGILDRFDAFFVSVPFVSMYIFSLGYF